MATHQKLNLRNSRFTKFESYGKYNLGLDRNTLIPQDLRFCRQPYRYKFVKPSKSHKALSSE